jgi:diguanylate cyclase (GGDEF)-like protein
MSDHESAEPEPPAPPAAEERVGPTVSDDLVAMLDLLTETIVSTLGFGVAVINLTRPDGSLEVASVAGDEKARAMLLGTVDSAAIWDGLLAASEPWGRLRFADHRSDAAYIDMLTWIPDIEPIVAEDAWHPADALFAPLIGADGTRVGVLSVDLPHDGRRPNAATRKALEGFAVSTALAIEHATLRARAEASEGLLRERASHDSLTGVGNRSMLFERLGHALTVRPDERTTLALAFIDLDRFKHVNDGFSHLVGDRVLTTVAQRIRSVVRPHDTVVRWGGDEFLVLFEHLDADAHGLTVVERILAAVAEPVLHEGHELRVTASIGVAFQRPGDDFDADELVRRADLAMYSVKNAGRAGFAVYDGEQANG